MIDPTYLNIIDITFKALILPGLALAYKVYDKLDKVCKQVEGMEDKILLYVERNFVSKRDMTIDRETRSAGFALGGAHGVQTIESKRDT